MSIKLLFDGELVDASRFPVYVYYDKRLKLFLACTKDKAQGVAAHDGSTYYHIDGIPEFGVDGYDTVTAVEIDSEEATVIMEALDAGKPLPEPEPEPEPDPEPEPEPEHPDGSIELVRANTIAQMSAACEAAIIAGVDLTLSDGKQHHFSLELEDQLNILTLRGMIEAGETVIPYHADGEECRFYSVEDFAAIVNAATNWKLYQESYFNSLRVYIQSMKSVKELSNVTYGMPIPDEYQTDVLKTLIKH